MTDFALLLFETGDDRRKSLTFRLLYKAGFYNSGMGARLFLRANDRAIREGMNRTELFEDMNAWIVKLPIGAALLEGFNGKAIEASAERFRSEKGLKACFMPSAMAGGDKFRDYKVRHGFRDVIFKSQLQYILEDIYEKNGIRLGSLDTVIVADEEAQEVYSVVKLLEPHFRYMTVAASKNSGMEESLAGISGETGLMINVTGSWKSVLKNADLIINLSRMSDLSGFRMKNTSLLINLNGGKSTKASGENAVINGIEYLLSADIFAALGTEVLRGYSKKELTETILDLALEETGAAADLFIKFGCRFIGYTGRRGTVKAENIIKAVIGKIMPVMG